jgi:hypothetical protein
MIPGFGAGLIIPDLWQQPANSEIFDETNQILLRPLAQVE